MGNARGEVRGWRVLCRCPIAVEAIAWYCIAFCAIFEFFVGSVVKVWVRGPLRVLSVRLVPHLRVIFSFRASKEPNLGPAAILSLLNACDVEALRGQVDAFIFGNASVDYETDIAFLRGFRSGVHIEVHRYGTLLDMARASSGAMRAYEGMRLDTEVESSLVFQTMLARLFVPLVLRAEWFFYADVDVVFYGDLVSAALALARGSDCVLWAHADPGVRKYTPSEQLSIQLRAQFRDVGLDLGVDDYFNAGLLLMRGGAELERELGVALRWLAGRRAEAWWKAPFESRKAVWAWDQDALNFGVNRSLVGLWPFELVGQSPDPRVSGPRLLAWHFVGNDKRVAFSEGSGPAYDAAKRRWEMAQQEVSGGGAHHEGPSLRRARGNRGRSVP